MLLDNDLINEAEHFAPYYSTMDVTKLYSVSKFVSLLGPGNNIMTNYLDPDNISVSGTDTIANQLHYVNVK